MLHFPTSMPLPRPCSSSETLTPSSTYPRIYHFTPQPEMTSLHFPKALTFNQLHGIYLPSGAFYRSRLCVVHLPHEVVSSLKAKAAPSVPCTEFPKVLFMEWCTYTSH